MRKAAGHEQIKAVEGNFSWEEAEKNWDVGLGSGRFHPIKGLTRLPQCRV